MKIALDFDGTLLCGMHDDGMRELAVILTKGGADLWILTARNNNVHSDNRDLFALANELNIPNEKIIFTDNQLKDRDFFNNEFDLLIDDNFVDIHRINQKGGFGLLCSFNAFQLLSEIDGNEGDLHI